MAMKSHLRVKPSLNKKMPCKLLNKMHIWNQVTTFCLVTPLFLLNSKNIGYIYKKFIFQLVKFIFQLVKLIFFCPPKETLVLRYENKSWWEWIGRPQSIEKIWQKTKLAKFQKYGEINFELTDHDW